MKNILEYVGIIIILLGVLFLALHHADIIRGNGTLATAAILFVVGLGAHIGISKYLNK
ncbi:MAG: hypothetical protein MJZ14_10935 [Paludibacteraceae bacterium]|nr:hypothetical protein [Paludibacteraceae bacterium]